MHILGSINTCSIAEMFHNIEYEKVLINRKVCILEPMFTKHYWLFWCKEPVSNVGQFFFFCVHSIYAKLSVV